LDPADPANQNLPKYAKFKKEVHGNSFDSGFRVKSALPVQQKESLQVALLSTQILSSVWRRDNFRLTCRQVINVFRSCFKDEMTVISGVFGVLSQDDDIWLFL